MLVILIVNFSMLIQDPHIKPARVYKSFVSLVPSLTELLFDLGLKTEVKGITKFCIRPAHWLKEKTIVGGTKKIHIEKIDQLLPDLLIANKEENTKEEIEEISVHYDVLVTDIQTLEQALTAIKQIGLFTGRKKESERLIVTIKNNFSDLRQDLSAQKKLNAAYLIWQKPFMTVGGDTFIHSMLERCNLHNTFGHKKRYPEISIKDLRESNSDIIILASEPFPFTLKHQKELQSVLKEKIITLANGEMFSWYGSRLQYAPAYFRQFYNNLQHSIFDK